jgi:L-ascorbate metabolism protein UlaG (beta-lactamase superfamily)
LTAAHFSIFYPVEDVQAGKPERALARAAADGRIEDEGWRVRKDGTRFWAHAVITAVRHGGGRLLGFAKVTRDLTERRRAEEDRVKLAQAEEALRLRDEFVALAAHELRNPLNPLLMSLQHLERELKKTGAGDRTLARVGASMRQIGRLRRLAEELLDVSRIRTGELTLYCSELELVDGFFTRPGKWSTALGRVAPDRERIGAALSRAGITRLAAVITVHSHYDHAMNSPEVAMRTGAERVGSASTANVGRGWGLPEARIRVVRGGERFTWGRFEVTLLGARHVPGAPAMGEIDAPLTPPVRATAYREGGSFSVLVRHGERTLLVQGSAGFEPGALAGRKADVVFLGVGLLGKKELRIATRIGTRWSAR